mgnify:CR=1 FL=1
MTTPTRTPFNLRNEPPWTPRQREVLDLLVRNRTNGQIAETLGISLDGAKWHVSEIITKLGVDTRARFVKLMFGLARCKRRV